ncbi:rod shape-determining protein [Pseudonocardia benzenivorans]
MPLLTTCSAIPATRSLLERAAAVAALAGGDPDAAVAARAATALRVGVDLGTATCVLVVLATGPDGRDRPVWVDGRPSGALADGVVVDFARAVATVRDLRDAARVALRTELPAAATAHPPCVPAADARACTFVCEAAGFDEVALVDEVGAAQRTLGLRDGVVVDVGGGSTGVGVYRAGELVALDDRPGAATISTSCSPARSASRWRTPSRTSAPIPARRCPCSCRVCSASRRTCAR